MIVVIGSNSFSGATFVAHALSQGCPVIGISRSPQPNPVFLPYRWETAHNGFSFEQLDVNNDLYEIMATINTQKPEYVVNFAAQGMVAESWKSPGDWFRTNTLGMVRLHDELRKCEFLKRYVHVSTPEVYGTCAGDVSEDHPFNPTTPYAVSRAATDMSLRTFHKAYGFPVVTTRAANVYGPGQQLYRIIPRTIFSILTGQKLQLHGGGTSTRSFIHMREVCEATWKIMREGRNGEAYHISPSLQITIAELVELICRIMNVKFNDHVEIVGERLGKDAAYLLSSGKLRHELGWSHDITLENGLSETIRWVTDNLEVLKQQSLDYQHKP